PRLVRFGEPLRLAARDLLVHHARVPRPRQHGAGDPCRGRSGDRRGPGRDRDRPVRGHTCGRGLQPLLPRRRPPRRAFRELHGGVLQHPAAAGSGETRGRVRSEGGLKAMRSRRLMNQINIVPYVAVMLVLLVIFLVTAPLVNPGMVDLPSVGKSSQPPATPLEVIVRRDQSLMLRERDKGRSDERAVSTGQLVAALRERQRKTPDQPVVISADKDVRYEAVLKVMDELQRQNIRRVGLLVKPATP